MRPCAASTHHSREHPVPQCIIAARRRRHAFADLAPFKGEDGKPIYVAADGLVFDMSSAAGGREFYGPGAGYSAFAGRCVPPHDWRTTKVVPRLCSTPTHLHLHPPRATCRDATIGLATMETNPTAWTKSKVEQLSAAETDTLSNWVTRFRQKYAIVGTLTDGARPTTVDAARAAGWLK